MGPGEQAQVSGQVSVAPYGRAGGVAGRLLPGSGNIHGDGAMRRLIDNEVAEARNIDPGDPTSDLDVLELPTKVRDPVLTRYVPGHDRDRGRQVVETGVVLALPVPQAQLGQDCR